MIEQHVKTGVEQTGLLKNGTAHKNGGQADNVEYQ
jgi:hypothetical protein